MTMTIEQIEALALEIFDRYFVTVDAEGTLQAPGLEISWDDQDPENEGWAYRTDGGSGPVDDLDDVRELLLAAAERAEDPDMLRA